MGAVHVDAIKMTKTQTMQKRLKYNIGRVPRGRLKIGLRRIAQPDNKNSSRADISTPRDCTFDDRRGNFTNSFWMAVNISIQTRWHIKLRTEIKSFNFLLIMINCFKSCNNWFYRPSPATARPTYHHLFLADTGKRYGKHFISTSSSCWAKLPFIWSCACPHDEC